MEKILYVENSINDCLKEAKKYLNCKVIIYIKEGIYKEVLEINQNNLTLIGIGNPIITNNRYALEILEDGLKRGTFRTYTVLINADNITLKNLTIENSIGSGDIYGQAIALYADGDNLQFDNCKLLGHQDTLFIGPLPEKEVEKGGFRGPKEFSPRRYIKQFYHNCYIEGDVDFIFGSGLGYFLDCTIYSLNRDKEVNGFITAASTIKDEKYGFIFNNCKFLSNCQEDTVYLGRPWREYAKTVIINSYLDKHIKKEGWHDWKKEIAHTTSFYAEKNNTGPSSNLDNRVSWIKNIDDISEYNPLKVLGKWINI